METITDVLIMALVIGVVIYLCRLIVKKKDSARTLSIVGGLLTILLGFVYMVVFVGLPYPDATLEEIAQQNFHIKITNVIVGVGIVGFLVGLVSGVVKFLSRAFMRPK